MVIVGAGVVRVENGALVAGWVPDSSQFWQSDRKSDHLDDHGKFTSDIFDTWFRKLCVELKELCGTCRIHMDGASYHKRCVNPIPTGSWNIPSIRTWLVDHGTPYEPSMRKVDLLNLVKALNVKKEIATLSIAAEFGHTVLYTPPYRPELQPIELIWASIKNAIGLDPPHTMEELKEMLLVGRERTEKAWKAVYRHIQKEEDKYAAQEDPILADDADGDDAGGIESDVGSDEDSDCGGESVGDDSDGAVEEEISDARRTWEDLEDIWQF
jgi:hypothetical protein